MVVATVCTVLSFVDLIHYLRGGTGRDLVGRTGSYVDIGALY